MINTVVDSCIVVGFFVLVGNAGICAFVAIFDFVFKFGNEIQIVNTIFIDCRFLFILGAICFGLILLYFPSIIDFVITSIFFIDMQIVLI